MTGHSEIIHWGSAEQSELPVGSVYCRQCRGWYKPHPVEHSLVQHKPDYAASPFWLQPQTNMSTEDAGALVHLLSRLPHNTGFLISHVIEQPHSPPMWGGYSAKVILPNGSVGEASHNNPALAFREAWAKAHRDWADKITPCDHEWKESVHGSTGSAWDHDDRFMFCVKCRTAKDKAK